MALAVYPFFAKVAEIVGRLTSLQGDCTTAEVHRRMAEIYGEREGTRRMTNMVLQSQVDWSLLGKSENGKTLTRKPPMALQSPETVQWMSEALLMHVGRPLTLDGLSGQPTMFPSTTEIILAMCSRYPKHLMYGRTAQVLASLA